MPNEQDTRRPKKVVTEIVTLSDSDKRVSVRVNRLLQEEMRKLKAGRRQMQLYVEEQIRKRR